MSGRGETFKSGGRVVKNVTGYDLCKLLAGSFGTLAAMTEVTIKTLPRPETEATVLVLGLDDARASAAMSAAMASSCDVSGAAHLPADLVMHFDGLHAAQAATAFRLEGFAPSVSASQGRARGLLQAVRAGRAGRRRAIRARSGASVRDAKPFSAERADRRPAAVAGLDRAGARLRVRRALIAAERAMVLRLGRRPDLDRDAAVRRRRRGARSAARWRRSAATPR